MALHADREAAGEPRSDTVWIVDDTPAVRLLASHTFGRAGWRTTEFEDLTSARAALVAQGVPAVVLLDVHLPDGCGLDEVRLFAEAGAAVMVMSNLARPEQRARAVANGAAQVVTKPLDMGSLLELAQALRVGEPPVQEQGQAGAAGAVL